MLDGLLRILQFFYFLALTLGGLVNCMEKFIEAERKTLLLFFELLVLTFDVLIFIFEIRVHSINSI